MGTSLYVEDSDGEFVVTEQSNMPYSSGLLFRIPGGYLIRAVLAYLNTLPVDDALIKNLLIFHGFVEVDNDENNAKLAKKYKTHIKKSKKLLESWVRTPPLKGFHEEEPLAIESSLCPSEFVEMMVVEHDLKYYPQLIPNTLSSVFGPPKMSPLHPYIIDDSWTYEETTDIDGFLDRVME
ncbi:hypothetical protein M422DRAFT_266146 [Sphaerobolus stellatus SS14]|uniref:Uncharacterized protein n=1 Tax=Sphaerobolus stellatus (strain SS14) TaxID=990650 RepID=A0A0C9UBN7_SPHS4|nr:hypothetical protein M422DRAFT_266146 [Sphaerobolus stellatus SS14]